MWSLLLAIPGLANGLLQYLNKRADIGLENAKAWLQATVQNNGLKVAANGWWGAKLIILMAGLPMAAHMAAVALDTLIPPYGSWGIPKLPPPYDAYERDIVLSFFIILPIQPVAGAIATGIMAWVSKQLGR